MKFTSFQTRLSSAVFTLLFGIFSAAPALAIGTPFLIKDITTKAAPANAGSLFDAGGGVLYFSATNGTSGNELFKYDGTSVTFVKDINPGSSSSHPGNFMRMGGLVYFTADNGVMGTELWKTDGTPDGTVLVAEINTGSFSSNPGMLTVMGGWLYFVADDGSNGSELWKTDGTAMFLVKDINPGTTGSGIQYLKAVGTKLFFWADNGTTGLELWTSDGTTAGTGMVADLNVYPYSPIYDLNGQALFAAGDGYAVSGVEPWVSDGTPGGTIRLDVTAGTNSGFHGSEFGVLGSFGYFMGGTMNTGSQNLYRTGGASADTGYFNAVRLPKKFVPVGSNLFFVGYEDSSGLYSVWKTDGTNTTKMAAPNTVVYWNNSNPPENLTNINGELYFTSPDSTLDPVYPTTPYLWKIDTNGNVIRVTTKASYPSNLTNVNGVVYFTSYGELWKCNGTDAGTVMVTVNSSGTTGTAVSGAINISGTTYFAADDGVTGAELWSSDGTAPGTVLVKDIYPGVGGSQPQNLTNVNGVLFFTAWDPTNGYALWTSNGTDAGTIALSGFQSAPQSLATVNGTLFFAGETSAAGWALWKSNGTVDGTVMVKDLDPTPYGAAPTNLTIVGGTLYFAGADGINGPELWSSDGTAAGTAMAKDLNSSYTGAGSSPAWLTNAGGTLFFTADDGVNGIELWKSGGTPAGTVMVTDLNTSTAGAGSNPIWLSAIGGRLYFAADNGINGYQLFVSDGTAGGTSGPNTVNLAENKNAFDQYTNPMFTELNGMAYFVADDGVTGMELWKSDGTAAGTVQVKDINPGAAGSSITSLTSSNGALYFTANDGVSGAELWQSDGTPAGTIMAADIQAGSGGSNPAYLVTSGPNLHLFADDGIHGNELMGSVLVTNISHNLSVSTTGIGSGTVRNDIGGISCSGTCSYSVLSGSMVSLVALPSTGSSFTGWSGPCYGGSGSGSSTCVVSMDAAKSVSADFTTESPVIVTWGSLYPGLGLSPTAGKSVQQTADGGYIVAGYTTADIYGESEGYIVKLNADGSTAWQRSYGTTGYSEHFTSVQQTADGGYIAAGDRFTFSGNDKGFLVIKLNADGTSAWERTYGGGSKRATTVKQTPDGGYLVFGLDENDGFWALKLQGDGAVIWSKIYGGGGQDWPTSMALTSDGGYVFTGTTMSFGASFVDAWVLKVSAGGAVDWEKRYNNGATGKRFTPRVIRQTFDGGYIFAGDTDAVSGVYDGWLVKLDAAGTVIWSKRYSDGGTKYLYDVHQTADGRYAVAGSSSGRALVLLVNSDGTIDWQKIAGTGAAVTQEAASIGQSADSSLIVSGTADGKLWVQKINIDGTVYGCTIGFASSGTVAADFLLADPVTTAVTVTDTTSSLQSASPVNYANTAVSAAPAEACSGVLPGFTVTFSAGSGGAVSSDSGSTVSSFLSQSGIVSGGSTSPAITAVPSSGYYFVNWSGPGEFSSTQNPLTVTNVTASMTITATFAPLSAPQVTGHSPNTGEVIDNITTISIYAYFAGPLRQDTINAATFVVKDQGGSPVAGTVTYDSYYNQATFTPSALLFGGGTYTVTVTTGVQNPAGTPLAADYSWSFTVTPYLGGVAGEGNLLVTPMSDGRIGIYRYISGEWQEQVYSWDSKGSRLQVNGAGYPLGYFSAGTAPSPVVNTQLSGSQTKTEWATEDGLRIIQELTYQPGAVYYGLNWKIANESAAEKTDLRFFHGEDTYFLGNDRGAGFWDAPNTTIGVQRALNGTELRRMSLQAITVPFAYDSEYYGTVVDNVVIGALTNTIDPSESTDNGYALEWRNASLPAGAAWSISAFEKFADVQVGTVSVTAPVTVACSAGANCSLTYTVTNSTASPADVTLTTTTDQDNWSATTASTALTVAAGSSQQVVVQLTIPAAAADGFIGHLTLSANNGSVTVSDTAAINVRGAYIILTGADGRTTVPTIVTIPGATLTLASGTLLTDATGNPVSGTLTVTASVMNSIASLPAGLATARTDDGKILSALGSSIGVTISSETAQVKTINPAMTVNLPIPSTFASAGATVSYYSYNGTSWSLEGSAAVKNDGSVDMPVGHLSVWAVAAFASAVDAVAPDVTGFTVPATSAAVTVPITTFTATDNIGVTGYLLSENSAPPLATDSGWTASAPTSYTLTTWGNRTLHAYAKDAAGNISAAGSAPIYVGIKPDVDGVIVPAQSKAEPQLADALRSLAFVMKADTPTAAEIVHGDVAPLVQGVPQPDGEINLGDTIVILRRVVGL